MKVMKYLLLFFVIVGLCGHSAAKATQEAKFQLQIEIPRHQVVEYHAPYIATWIEDESQQAVSATSLWYDEQDKWLKDIRRWWRKTGRQQDKPYDGVTAATRRPGTHKLDLNIEDTSAILKPGKYSLMVEAAREVGGREVVQLPFTWPIDEAVTIKVKGKSELGLVTLTIKH